MPTARIEGLTTERFAHILSVAIEEFASSRYKDASFNRIIKNCQMAKGTMYYYFKSKEDLFLTIHKATLRDFRKVTQLSMGIVLTREAFWSLAEDLLLEFYRTLYRKPAVSQFVTNFLTQESRSEGHPAIATVNAIEVWIQDFLACGQDVQAIRRDLPIDQLTILSWGIWESCRNWLPSEANRMQSIVHPDIILDIFRRTLAPVDGLVAFYAQDPSTSDLPTHALHQLSHHQDMETDSDDSPFMGASPEAMDFEAEN